VQLGPSIKIQGVNSHVSFRLPTGAH
jgi:hypothetical protein